MKSLVEKCMPLLILYNHNLLIHQLWVVSSQNCQQITNVLKQKTKQNTKHRKKNLKSILYVKYMY